MSAALGPGSKFDRYTILEPIGSGGMGEVYRAHDERLHRTVALKILRPPSDKAQATSPMSTDGAARMLREARAAAALDHPNVVAIFDVGEVKEPNADQATTYLAMELIKGRPLRAFIGDKNIPPKKRVRWLLDVARALGAAHNAGLVHRDIKPENVMIRDDGVVKVLDFGIAKRAHQPADPHASTAGMLPTLTTEGIVIGTPYYMSPEQLRNEKLDGRSDQFAWGVVAYELLTGAPPWSLGAEPVHLIAEILSKEAAPIALPDVPSNVGATVLRALSKQREARFASMEDLVTAIEGTTDPVAPTEHHESSRDVTPAPPADTRATTGVTAPKGHTGPGKRRTVWLPVGGVVVAAIIAAAVARSRAPGEAPKPAAAAPECTTAAQCISKAGGKPARCLKPEGKCVLLENEDCKVFAEKGDLENDETVWIGTMFPTGDPSRPFAAREQNAIELARREFAGALGSFRPTPGAPPVRPLAVVACDDAKDAKRAALHLADTVRAPAVIGFATSSEAVDLTNSIFLPHGTVVLASLNMSPLVTSVPQPPSGPRLVWRTTYTTNVTAEALAQFVEHFLEPQIRKNPRLQEGDIRVAVVRPQTATGASFSETFFTRLRFNGKTALENGSLFREFPMSLADVTGVVAELQRYAPHVIAYVAGDTEKQVEDVILRLERGWPSRTPFRPYYATISMLTKGVLDFIGTDANRRHHFFGVTTVSTTTTNAQFVMRLNAAFDTKATRTDSPNSSYDAFYLLAYASHAMGRETPTGSGLAAGFARLMPPGEPVDVGPANIFRAFNTLRAGKNIDLNGATGSLDFDLAQGEAPVRQAIVCPAIDADGRANDSVESGLVYDPGAQALEGALRCP